MGNYRRTLHLTTGAQLDSLKWKPTDLYLSPQVLRIWITTFNKNTASWRSWKTQLCGL